MLGGGGDQTLPTHTRVAQTNSLVGPLEGAVGSSNVVAGGVILKHVWGPVPGVSWLWFLPAHLSSASLVDRINDSISQLTHQLQHRTETGLRSALPR